MFRECLQGLLRAVRPPPVFAERLRVPGTCIFNLRLSFRLGWIGCWFSSFFTLGLSILCRDSINSFTFTWLTPRLSRKLWIVRSCGPAASGSETLLKRDSQERAVLSGQSENCSWPKFRRDRRLLYGTALWLNKEIRLSITPWLSGVVWSMAIF